MGLDVVEIVLAVEDTFQISLPDKEAEKIATVGDLHEFIISKLATANHQPLYNVAFYRLRRALMSSLDLPRRGVTPRTKLDEIIPKDNRREHWQRISTELNLQLPSLRRPGWLQVIMNTGVGIPSALGALLLLGKEWRAGVCAVGSGVVFYRALHTVIKPLAVWIPPNCTTVGDAVKALVKDNFSQLSEEHGRWLPQEVLEILTSILSEHLGISKHKIHRGSHLVKDLGAN